MMRILLRRSQITLDGLQRALSKFFEIVRVTEGRHHWLEGRRVVPSVDAIVTEAIARVEIPLAERLIESAVQSFLARFSNPLYHLRITGLDPSTLLDLARELQGAGADLGFEEEIPPEARHWWSLGGKRIWWPSDRQAQLDTAAKLRRMEAEIVLVKPLLDLDFFVLSLRNVTRRKLRTFALVAVMSIVCANFIHHVTFSISEGGLAFVTVRQWELPLAAGFLALITYLNLVQISLYERLVEIGTIRALGAETTTTLLIFATEGMTIGAIGAMMGYTIVVAINSGIKLLGVNPALDLAAACSPAKAILGLFLGIVVGFIGSVLPIIPVVWMAPERCLAGPK